jgi:phenylacetate-CoA ligase
MNRAVAHARRNVPFYRRIWKEAGVDPGRVRRIEDLALLPVIDPETARDAARNGELLAAGTPADIEAFPSGGSTGAALRVPRGEVEARLWRAGGVRIQFEHGFHWRDRTVQFGRRPGPPHPLQRFGIAATDWISGEAPLAEQVACLAASRPHFVFGHVAVLRRAGLGLLEHNVRLPPPKAVFALGEVLDDESRATIREGFGSGPVDVYGMSETGFIGWQCGRRRDLHVNADCIFTEILRDGVAAAPGEIGRVVVTTLRARTMPLLRFDTGDLARAGCGPCDCGRQLPTMGRVEGRARDAVTAYDGRVVTQRAVLDRLAGTLKMGEYRIRRTSEHRFVLEATSRAFANSAGPRDARRIVRSLFGEVELETEECKEFPARLKTHAFVDERGEAQ